jgi:rhodanese-related sulfurtransferase
LEILYLLSQSERTVESLAKEASLSMANTSQHLQRLKQAQLVREVREGVHIRYHIADPSVIRLWLELRSVAERQLAEVERVLDAYRHRRHELEKISVDELQARLRSGDVILIDVRPREEYHAGHLPGAISSPLAELEPRVGEIPRDKTIVVYCRGPYCVYSDEAIELLVEQGLTATRLEEGVVEWQQYGYALER